MCAGALQLSTSTDQAKPRRWSKSRPYWGRITAIESLCSITCAEDRDTVRVEIDLGESGLSYIPGDALGVYPHNTAEVGDICQLRDEISYNDLATITAVCMSP